MGVNATTFVPAYVAGEILTAADLTVTNSGIPVFATTVTRDAAFGGSGEKVLAEGQYAYIEATNTTQFYDGAAWQAVGGGLTYITQATPSAVSSISINGCFTSTYDNYLVLFSPTSVSSAATTGITIRLRVAGTDSTTNYASQRLFAEGTSVSTTSNPNGTDEWIFGYAKSSINGQPSMSAELFKPFLTTPTGYLSNSYGNDSGPFIAINNGTNTASTSYDGFTVSIDAGTITGTIRVYGYQNS